MYRFADLYTPPLPLVRVGKGYGMFGFAARGAATAAIAGALVFSFPAMGVARAEGIPGGVTLLTRVAAGGGVGIAAAAPEVMAAAGSVCATGVGCAVLAGAVAIGVGLYLTRDTWQPWLAQQWGQTQAGGGWSYGGGYRVNIDSQTSGTGIVFNGERVQTPGEPMFIAVQVNGTMYCSGGQNGANGTGISQQILVDDAHGGSNGYYFTSWGGAPVQSGVIGCGNSAASSGTLLGFRGHAQTTTGELNVVTWGTKAPASQTRTKLRVSCKNPDGSTYEVIGPETITGPGTPIPDNGVIQPTCAGAPGSQPGAVGRCITLLGALSASAPMETQSSSCAAVGQAEATIAARYPNCVGGVHCTYVIRLNGQPCTIGATGCQNWATLAQTNPGAYECYWGSYNVGLGACALLERAYETANQTGTMPATGPNTDGDPTTWTAPTPVIAPPTAPWTPPAPAPVPLPSPCTAGEACGIPPAEGQACFPSGWGAFNPVSWVQQPIQCALTWAFVPKSANINTTGIRTQLDRAGIAPSVAALTDAVSQLGGEGGGCMGPSINFDIAPIHQVVTPFAACTAPMSTVAQYAYAISSVTVVIAGAMKILSLIAGGFGYQMSLGSKSEDGS